MAPAAGTIRPPQRPAPQAGKRPLRLPARPAYALAFLLLLAVTATLLIRPAEIVPALEGLPLFQGLILAALALALPAVAGQLRPAALRAQPITACVVGMVPFLLLSNLANLNIAATLRCGAEVSKTVLFYLLLVGVVTTADRLRWLLFTVVGCTSVLVVLILAQHFGVLSSFQIQTLQEHYSGGQFGEEVVFARVRGTGLFGDPNEICLILVFSLMLSLYGVATGREGAHRWLGLLPAALFAVTVALTRSRGGFLALLSALLTFLCARFGTMRTLLLAGVGLPALLLAYGGRQTQISAGEVTAQERLGLWRDAFVFLAHNPVFGIGYDQFAQWDRWVVHNSFLHCFTEIGLLGGTLFLGAFFFAFREIRRAPRASRQLREPELAALRPCLLGSLAGYFIGCQTVSYCYLMPTYLVLGIFTAYLRVSADPAASFPARLNARLLAQFLAVSLVYLVGLYIFVASFG